MDAKDLLIDSDGESRVEQFKTFLGIKQEIHTCPECNEPCEESTTHDANRMAFDGGESLSWQCPECGREFVRESDDSILSADLYDR